MAMITRSCKGGHSIHYGEHLTSDGAHVDPLFVNAWLEQHVDCVQPAVAIVEAIRESLHPIVEAIVEEARR